MLNDTNAGRVTMCGGTIGCNINLVVITTHLLPCGPAVCGNLVEPKQFRTCE